MVHLLHTYIYTVAPFTGAWIEISSTLKLSAHHAKSHPSRVRGLKSLVRLGEEVSRDKVAPFTGAWIEIPSVTKAFVSNQPSHPSRVRGLKFIGNGSGVEVVVVAPFTGAWIEIVLTLMKPQSLHSRTLHGCVD